MKPSKVAIIIMLNKNNFNSSTAMEVFIRTRYILGLLKTSQESKYTLSSQHTLVLEHACHTSTQIKGRREQIGQGRRTSVSWFNKAAAPSLNEWSEQSGGGSVSLFLSVLQNDIRHLLLV